MIVDEMPVPDLDALETRHLDCVCCRVCGSVLRDESNDSKAVRIHGVRTRTRVKLCTNPQCRASFSTAEIPIEVALDLWDEGGK